MNSWSALFLNTTFAASFGYHTDKPAANFKTKFQNPIVSDSLTDLLAQDGDPPEKHTFSEHFPELFRRLIALRSPADPSVPLIEEIKAFRLKGSTQELQDMMGEAFVSRGLGPLRMTVRSLSGAVSEVPVVAAHGDREPVSIIIEESTAPDSGTYIYASTHTYLQVYLHVYMFV